MADEVRLLHGDKLWLGLIRPLRVILAAAVMGLPILAACQPSASPQLVVQSTVAETEIAPQPAPERAPVPSPQPPRTRQLVDKDYPLPDLQDRGEGRFELREPSVEITLTLPESPEGKPVLLSILTERNTFFEHTYENAHAIEDNTEPDDPSRRSLPFKSESVWAYTAQAGDWVSLFGSMWSWIGQAHPEWGIRTIIAHRDGARVKFESMFSSDYPPVALAIAVCEAVRVEKLRKGASPTTWDDEPIVCDAPEPNISIGRVALAPSDREGKFGGIRVYYSQYEVGSYAEGFYAVTTQQNVFVRYLKPEYRDLFGGTAPPLPPMN